MNDLSTLKRALDEPPGFIPRDLDVDGIVHAGRGLRRRRRLAVGTASAAAVAAVLIGGSLVTPSAPAVTENPATAASSAPADPGGPLGDVIGTGLKTRGGEWVLYVVSIAQMPGVRFGIMLGVRAPGGGITAVVEINETVGSALAPGFHEGEGSQNLDGRNSLTFGYYVGQPYRISAKVHGKQVSAHFKAWSSDPSVTLFWFSPADAGPEQPVTGMAAYDRQGAKMVSGHPTFGLG